MAIHIDPDGYPNTLTDSSAITLHISDGVAVHLDASFDSAWEQAVTAFINGVPFEGQLGSYILRPNFIVIPPQAEGYELTLVGWHKRCRPNAHLPWVASRGRRFGAVVFAWDDSADDEDYRDIRVKLVTS